MCFMKELVLVKLGGSLITDKRKPFTARLQVIKRLAKEIRAARVQKNFSLVIGHGGGSFPHQPAACFQTHKGFINKDSMKGFALVQDAASRLNRIIVKAFLDAGENAVSVQPSAGAIARGGRIVFWDLSVLKKLLEKGFTPIVYGDAAVDEKQGCAIISTEEIFCFLAKKLGARRVVVAADVDGVFDRDPRSPNSSLVKKITPKMFPAFKPFLGASAGADVTGGMLHKTERLVEIARAGIPSIIVNGLKPNRLRDALLGKKVVGTLITR